MLSQTRYVDKKTKKTVLLDNAKTNEQKNQVYIGLFLAAVDKAAIEYKESEVNGSDGITVVDIDAMRDLIKTPIPFYN